MTELLELFKKQNKSFDELNYLYYQTKLKLTPFITIFSLQSHSEYLELIKLITLIEISPYSLISSQDLDSIYLLYSGQMKLDILGEIDHFNSKKIQKKKYQEDIPEGYLIDKSNIHKIFAIEQCFLLKLDSKNITTIMIKHEQLIRAKRLFFYSLFKPQTKNDKQKITYISDSLQLYHYDQNQKIISMYQHIEYLYIIFLGNIQLFTRRNTLMNCKTYDMFNEECSVANYSAQVMSQNAELFQITPQIIQEFPECAKIIIEQSKKIKCQLRHRLVELNIIDIQLSPQLNNIKKPRFKSMQSLEKLFKPIQTYTIQSQQEFNKKKLSTGNIDQDIEILLDKNHFPSNRIIKSQTTDKSKTISNFSKYFNQNEKVKLTKQSKKIQSLCLLPDMSKKII